MSNLLPDLICIAMKKRGAGVGVPRGVIALRQSAASHSLRKVGRVETASSDDFFHAVGW